MTNEDYTDTDLALLIARVKDASKVLQNTTDELEDIIVQLTNGVLSNDLGYNTKVELVEDLMDVAGLDSFL